MRRRDESGQLTVMVIGFVVIVLLMVTVMANASKAFLHRRSLSSWADGAALVAAQSVSEAAVYAGELGDVVPLAEGEARSAVSGYVSRHGLPGRFTQFSVATVTVDPAGQTVTVTFAARVPLVWTNETTPFGGGVPISAEATAVAIVR